MEISGIYKITNTITGDFYIGSSKNVKERWRSHKKPSSWKQQPNNPMYQDMRKYGVDKFVFEILAEVEPDSLKEKEQEFIEMLKPTYNNIRAKGLDVERYKESQKKASIKYEKTDKRKKWKKEYEKSEKRKEYKKQYNKKYCQSDKCKEYHKEYDNQLCCYNGETLTLCALSKRFRRKGIPHPTLEAKKYLLQ